MKKVLGKFCAICFIILFLIPGLSGSSEEKKYRISFKKYTGPFCAEMVDVLIQKLSSRGIFEIIDESQGYGSSPKVDHYIFVRTTGYETTISKRVEFIAFVNLRIIEANTGVIKKVILKKGKRLVTERITASQKRELYLFLIDKIVLELQNYYR